MCTLHTMLGFQLHTLFSSSFTFQVRYIIILLLVKNTAVNLVFQITLKGFLEGFLVTLIVSPFDVIWMTTHKIAFMKI